ncbi:5-hydroxytryptamine receptor 2A-like [Oncorhynchus kisutch]|uniref:5-hydroxytryptamine receptor 2A-like n=1 Tax=Oncorhynchus kisutch TaxID=8019 RepID=UPI0012DE2208|nr:5-hydroxytryptamine receptor 2A-like [Oncorhynchus kisutch]
MVVSYFLTISALQTEATLCMDQLVPRPKWSATLTLSFFPQASLSSEKLFFRRSLSHNTGGVGRGVGVRYGCRTMQSISNKQKASQGPGHGLLPVCGHVVSISNVLKVMCDPHGL